MKTLLAFLCLYLAACSSTDSLKPDPFVPAKLQEAEAPPVTVVAVPKPLPLPGQLKPLPARAGHGAEPDLSQPKVGAATIDGAKAAARQEPSRDGYLNAVQVYPYTEGALYRLYGAPGQVTDVALEPGEELISVSAGDTLRWIIGDTTSGTGDQAQVHILVKPAEEGLKTNMVIHSDRRSYHLEMESLSETYMASLSWHYPHDQLLLLKAKAVRARTAAKAEVAAGLDPMRLNFAYRITGDKTPWRPLRAFDDGEKVYIQLPDAHRSAALPPLFVLSADGSAELVNYRMQAGYFVVDRLFTMAELRAGEGKQKRVRIERREPFIAGRR